MSTQVPKVQYDALCYRLMDTIAENNALKAELHESEERARMSEERARQSRAKLTRDLNDAKYKILRLELMI